MLDRFQAWWGRRARWQKIVLIIVAISVVFGPFISDTPADKQDEVAQSATTTNATDTPSTTAVTEKSATGATESATSTTVVAPEATAAITGDTSTTLGPPLFTVVEEEDISFLGAVRISLSVTVERGTTKAQLSALAADLAARYRETHEYQAFNVSFYHHRELAFGLASLGIWDDSPFGDWSRADEVERGDYSQHKPNDATREKDWSSVPSAGQVAVYLAYTVTYDVMHVGDELPSDDDVFAAVAAQRSVSAAEVEDAVNAVRDWMFSGG